MLFNSYAFILVFLPATLAGLSFADLGARFQGREEVLSVGALLGLAWLAPNTQEIMSRFSPALDMIDERKRSHLLWRPSIGWAVVIAVLTLIPLLQLTRISEFLYYQF